MKKTLLFLLLVFLSKLAFSQKTLEFDFDFARFGYDSSSNFIEFYYSFGQDDLGITASDQGFKSIAVLHIEIQDTLTKQTFVNKIWKIDNPVADTAKRTTGKSLIGVIGIPIPTGNYKCTVTGSDGSDSTKMKSIVEYIKVSPYINENISVSDIQLCSNIKQDNADSTSIFYKNTLEVIPNPTMLYGVGVPILFYYTELYNLKMESNPKDFILKSIVYNSKGARYSSKSKKISQSNNSRVEVGTVNISKFPTDTYTLALYLVDSVSNVGMTSSKKFFVYNPGVKDTQQVVKMNTDVLSSQFNILSEEECDQMYEKGKYVAMSKEIDQYNDLDSVQSKRQFLFDFWKRRDTEPSTPENEFYNEYMERVRLSDDRYGTINRAGNRTDRGRIYVLYGEPDQIDRYPSDIDKKPYEIWQYNQIEGGVIFIFGDVTGFSNYELLHSTKRGELRDDNWMARIQTN
ncbi:MAG: GWxTD domain-containing protein [Ignavibacteriales bacterium]|nr:MAG: GWxTD domain-containing protein [Ignavibacteriales bacterium]